MGSGFFLATTVDCIYWRKSTAGSLVSIKPAGLRPDLALQLLSQIFFFIIQLIPFSSPDTIGLI